MPDDIRAPIRSYEQIRQQVGSFLGTYHPSLAVPIPVEEIIALTLEMNIVPMPGLRRDFAIEAFTTSACTEIYVDDFIYRKRLTRYRFSLAHELGHIVLHRSLFEQAGFRSIQAWKLFLATFPEDEYSWFEFQAYSFAGLLLVPREPLEEQTKGALTRAAEHGINVDPCDATAWEYIADFIARKFLVSKEVILRRLEKDEIRSVAWLHDHGFRLE